MLGRLRKDNVLGQSALDAAVVLVEEQIVRLVKDGVFADNAAEFTRDPVRPKHEE
ncbi:MAG TPA: hypothetical protein VNR64_10690 [Vicinamibacterales bacterium]|nr:hypothetical protein [Vicinamibacterales bacterium]